MLEVLLWSLPRLLIAATPLVLAIMAAERAFASVGDGAGRSAPVWMLHAGFSAVSGASLLPWAMHLQPVNATGLLLSVIAVALWPVLGALLRRPSQGARAAEVVVVFRHRPLSAAPQSGLQSAPRSAPQSLRPAETDADPVLPFLRPIAGRIALGAAEWHQRACAPSLRPMSAF
jgi:hypothetical protein